MYLTIAKIAISSCLIAFSSWLAGKRPELAGFIIALPVNTMLVLALSYGQYHDPASAVKFARGIFAAIPLSLMFFIPFLLAERLPVGFWGLYGLGFACLVAGYFIHTTLAKNF
jgi:hypothetical protein